MSVAVVYLWGDNLKPDDISEAVGFAATSSNLKGQETKLANGRTMVAKTGIWSIQTLDLGLGDNLADHVTFLTYNIFPKLTPFIETGLIQKTRLSMIISTSSLEEESQCFELPSDVVSVLSSCKASIMITALWPHAADYDQLIL